MNWYTRTFTVLSLLALLVAGLAACGGDDDDDDAAPFSPDSGDDAGNGDDNGDQGDDSASDGDDPGSDDGDDSDGFDFGVGTARVTVGDTIYEFDLSEEFVVCRDVFGIIQVEGPGADGAETRVSMEIPPTDWESYDDGRYDPPSIEVRDDENGVFWKAGPDDIYNIPEGKSQVDSYEKDGLRASGTATFIDLNKLGISGDGEEVTAQGSFEVACEEE